jgi:hypothetical protein
VSGAAAGVLALAKPAASSTGPVAVGEKPRWDVAGFAASFVAVFVGAGETDQASLVPFLGSKPAELAGLTGGNWYAARVTTVDLTNITDARWSVKVAADLLRRESDPASPFVAVGVRYFQVDVVAQGSKLVAARLPSLVDAPDTGTPVVDGERGTRPVRSTGLRPAGGCADVRSRPGRETVSERRHQCPTGAGVGDRYGRESRHGSRL